MHIYMCVSCYTYVYSRVTVAPGAWDKSRWKSRAQGNAGGSCRNTLLAEAEGRGAVLPQEPREQDCCSDSSTAAGQRAWVPSLWRAHWLSAGSGTSTSGSDKPIGQPTGNPLATGQAVSSAHPIQLLPPLTKVVKGLFLLGCQPQPAARTTPLYDAFLQATKSWLV